MHKLNCPTLFPVWCIYLHIHLQDFAYSNSWQIIPPTVAKLVLQLGEKQSKPTKNIKNLQQISQIKSLVAKGKREGNENWGRKSGSWVVNQSPEDGYLHPSAAWIYFYPLFLLDAHFHCILNCKCHPTQWVVIFIIKARPIRIITDTKCNNCLLI